jgi:hypothetical protein
MASILYFVKRESGLFRKGSWNVLLNNAVIGMHPDRETALTSAVGEADRTSYMGRQSEVWVYEGDGFVLHKAFKAQKRPDEEDDIKEQNLAGDEDILFTVDDPTTDAASY